MFDVQEFERTGFAIVPDVTSPEKMQGLIALTELHAQSESGLGGVRNLLNIAGFRLLADAPEMRSLANTVLGKRAFVVRGILFDKTDATNWKVPWHQDVTIAVTERRPVAGYGPWSVKAGVTHVQPPREVLEGMVSVRLHLDDCSSDNGPLRGDRGDSLNRQAGA